ncbi:MAG: KEOPS complex subunit Cgi121 [Promethearchaeota archaeon]
MIKKEMNIKDLNLRFYVGAGQVNINCEEYKISNNLKDDKTSLNHVFAELESLEQKFKDSTIQFIKGKYLINQDHLFTACYYVQKAFINQINISNTKNLELLLYLSTNRQIQNGITAFGIDDKELKSNKLFYCIISPDNNLIEIKNNILKNFGGLELESEIFQENLEKYNVIKEFFQINDNQVKVITNSYKGLNNERNDDLKNKFNALYELVCEKMAILSLEKIKLDYT